MPLKIEPWGDILKKVRSNQKLEISNDIAFVGRTISIFDTCIDGENLSSISSYPQYDLVDTNNGEDFKEVYVRDEFLVFPITYMETIEVCKSDDRNCRDIKSPVTQKLSKKLTVRKFIKTVRRGRDDDEDIYKTLFTKEYKIPHCMSL